MSYLKKRFTGNAGLKFEKAPDATYTNIFPDASKPTNGPDAKQWIEAGAYGNAKQLTNHAKRLATLAKTVKLHILDLKLESPLLIGTGIASAYDAFGLLWHRTLGVPYIPGSSLKGVCKTWYNYTTKPTGEEPQSPNPQDTSSSPFGSQKSKGEWVFFDAIPTAPPHIEIDILNPHYPDWYNQNAWPGDWQNPIPITFPVIAAGTMFRTLIGVPGDYDASNNAINTLTQAVEYLGVGAKTSRGYGVLTQAP
ncbi:type III-B CRISPR module RAMP protein Cmr6 [Woodsholea maritima]|uniref:type III-B CRISPR module RAMP protein Cmr6 n=1 Tax=Woodsholea maritima TaxID=240237 RepID=UPI00037F4B9E|nr:type III-B CRISPR module RAMP protein Cmr6 [Woodsholea maritima]